MVMSSITTAKKYCWSEQAEVCKLFKTIVLKVFSKLGLTYCYLKTDLRN